MSVSPCGLIFIRVECALHYFREEVNPRTLAQLGNFELRPDNPLSTTR